jgi:ribose 5-phosphate isomerase B
MNDIYIGSDHGGFLLKEKIKAYLSRKGIQVTDVGTFSEKRVDYPIFAYTLAKKVAAKKSARGILICKSGIGNSIVANKVPGIRAALCYNQKAARLSREHNDSNILVLGSVFTAASLAMKITDIWLKTDFLAGRHKRRLNQIKKIEKEVALEERQKN